MKKLLTLLILFCIGKGMQAQYVYTIKADSVKITNSCDTAELIIENHTQNVPGFLYNKGKGRTEFRRAVVLNDSTLLLGVDTLVLRGNFASNNGLSMAGKYVQLGQSVGASGNPAALQNDREIPLNGNSINFFGASSDYNLKVLNTGAVLFGVSSGSSSSPSIQFGNAARGIWSQGSGQISIKADIGLASYLTVRDAGLTKTGVDISDEPSGLPTARLTVRQNTAITRNDSSDFKMLQIKATLSPSSGSVTLKCIQIDPTINQTGSANGISRGLFVNPTITSAASWRGIELEPFGSGHYAIKQNGQSDTNYFAGRTRFPNLFTQTDSAACKPLVVDASGNVFKMASWNTPQIVRTAVNDAGYSALSTDYLIAYTALSAPRTVTLPAASGMTNHILIVKDESGTAGTNNITINVTAGGTIDGASSKVITSNYGVIEVYSNGSQWFTK